MRTIIIGGSDRRLDCRDNRRLFDTPVNKLTILCHKCGFPDLDTVPKPYYLIKNRTKSANEFEVAEAGNFLIKERVKKIIELVLPGLCEFHPTFFEGYNEETPWFLAKPLHYGITGEMDRAVTKCKTCGNYLKTPYKSWEAYSEWDISKSENWRWYTIETFFKSKRWRIDRDLLLSFRTFTLFKELKIKTLYQYPGYRELPSESKRIYLDEIKKPTPDERIWIDKQYELVKAKGLHLPSSGSTSFVDKQWFKELIKQNSQGEQDLSYLKALEKKNHFALPKTMKEFYASINSLELLDKNENTKVFILPIAELNFENFRKGKVKSEEGEADPIDGVEFARTEFGDSFCFVIDKQQRDSEIYLFNHELFFFELYANNFVEFLKRIV